MPGALELFFSWHQWGFYFQLWLYFLGSRIPCSDLKLFPIFIFAFTSSLIVSITMVLVLLVFFFSLNSSNTFASTFSIWFIPFFLSLLQLLCHQQSGYCADLFPIYFDAFSCIPHSCHYFSVNKLNKYGDKGQPCLTPFLIFPLSWSHIHLSLCFVICKYLWLVFSLPSQILFSSLLEIKSSNLPCQMLLLSQ